MWIWNEIKITSPGFCLPTARVIVNNLRDARICEIYRPIPGQAQTFFSEIPSFWPTLSFNSFLPDCAVPTGIPSLNTSSLVLLLHYAIFLPLFVVSLGWHLFRPLLPHYVPLGWHLLSSLVFEQFPYFLGYLKHTLWSLNKREDLGENLFNITTIGQIFPKWSPLQKIRTCLIRSEHVYQNMFNH